MKKYFLLNMFLVTSSLVAIMIAITSNPLNALMADDSGTAIPCLGCPQITMTDEPTDTPTRTPSRTPGTPTATRTPTASATRTATFTSTPTPSATGTRTMTPTATRTTTLLPPSTRLHYVPMVANQLFKPTSPSYYMLTINGFGTQIKGCNLANQLQAQSSGYNHIVILNFGTPVSTAGPGGNELGTDLNSDVKVTIAQIETAVQYFAIGYRGCLSDLNSSVTFAIGTNNYYAGSVTYAHGAAWAQMINRLNAWRPSNYIPYLQFNGAFDAENGWNSPTITRNWISGYASVANAFYYFFGTAEGCPYPANPTWACNTAAYPEWTQDDVLYMAWGAYFALPVPEIYTTDESNAQQWYWLSLYAASSSIYGKIRFQGSLTQQGACNTHSCQPNENNSPWAGYSQLQYWINSDTSTAYYINWATDISYYP
jgi:hypothetical protein